MLRVSGGIEDKTSLISVVSAVVVVEERSEELS
jgi:hypothetical protein